MMISVEAIWLLVRYVVIPVAIACVLYFGGYHNGSDHKQKEFDAFKQAIKETSDNIVTDGLRREKELADKNEAVNRQIEEQAHVHATQITALNESNRTLLHQRVLRDSTETNCHSAAVPKTSKASDSGNIATNPGRIILSEDEGLAIINAAREADEITESLRACRAYIESLGN